MAAGAVACIGLAVSVSGCGSHSRHPRTGAAALSIYTSLPLDGPYAVDAGAIYDGEQLALTQAGGVVNGARVVLRRLDAANSSAGANPTLIAENAHAAAADQSTIAYIGELTPGSSPQSMRILGPAGILQVSPGDTATDLAGKTFARVVPQDSDEADAQLAALQKLKVSTVYLVGDRTTHGRDIAAAVLADAVNYGISVVDPLGRYLRADSRALVKKIKKSKAGALLYAGAPAASVAPFWNALSAVDGTIKKMTSASITDSPSWALTTAAARSGTYLSAPGLRPRALPRAGTQFETDFTTAYGGRVPWASGIFGYVAMSGVLVALHSLGPHAESPRSQIVAAFLHLRDVPSALGTYSIMGGQTSFRGYAFSTYHRYGTPPAYVASLS